MYPSQIFYQLNFLIFTYSYVLDSGGNNFIGIIRKKKMQETM